MSNVTAMTDDSVQGNFTISVDRGDATRRARRRKAQSSFSFPDPSEMAGLFLALDQRSPP